MKKVINVLKLSIVVFLFTACATPQVAYFQDAVAGGNEKVLHSVDIKIQPGDKISILVNSKDPLLTNLFNLPYVSRQLGRIEGQTMGTPLGMSGYTVSKSGNIDFPVLGTVKIVGMNREEIALHIKNQLMSKNLVKDPVVTVEFINLTVSVLGEVNRPGRYKIDKDRMTLIDAIGLAGDLTIYGKRDAVIVQREEKGKRKFYKINLGSAYDLYSSPAYYLQQNDVVYVEPNEYKAKDSTVNNKALRWSSIWIAVASLLTTITIAFTK